MGQRIFETNAGQPIKWALGYMTGFEIISIFKVTYHLVACCLGVKKLKVAYHTMSAMVTPVFYVALL